MRNEWIPSCARATFTFGKRRPGQWTDATRDKRRKRLAKAAYRRDVVRMFNARGREWRVLNRKQRRADARRMLEWRAHEWGIASHPHEFTRALEAKLLRAEVRPAGEAMAAALLARGAGDSVLAAANALETLGEVAPDLAPWVGAVQVTIRPWVR